MSTSTDTRNEPKWESFDRGPESWDKSSDDYVALMNTGPLQMTIHHLLKAMHAVFPLNEASAIADVGCGPGTVLLPLISDYGAMLPDTCRIVASDYSPEMVEHVHKVRASNLSGTHAAVWQRVETGVWDINDLSEAHDGEFSHMTASLLYCMLDEPHKALVESRRVLKDDGVLALSSFSKTEWMDTLDQATRLLRPDIAESRPPLQLPLAWASPEPTIQILEQAGFKEVKAEYGECFLELDEPAVFLKWFVHTKNPGIMKILGALSDSERDRVADEAVKMVFERHFERPVKLKGVAVIATARK